MRFGLSDTVVQRLHEVFASCPKVSRAIVYGSRARGDYRPNSDIDITLEGEELELSDLTMLMFKLDDLLLPYNIDLSIFAELKNEALIANIKKEGITL